MARGLLAAPSRSREGTRGVFTGVAREQRAEKIISSAYAATKGKFTFQPARRRRDNGGILF
jgi:hypothetical protein